MRALTIKFTCCLFRGIKGHQQSQSHIKCFFFFFFVKRFSFRFSYVFGLTVIMRRWDYSDGFCLFENQTVVVKVEPLTEMHLNDYLHSGSMDGWGTSVRLILQQGKDRVVSLLKFDTVGFNLWEHGQLILLETFESIYRALSVRKWLIIIIITGGHYQNKTQ